MSQHGVLRPIGAGTARTLQENEVPDEAMSTSSKNAANPEAAKTTVREFGLSVADFGGIGGRTSGDSFRGFGSLGTATPTGYTRHRKRPADEACFVDDEFRTPESSASSSMDATPTPRPTTLLQTPISTPCGDPKASPAEHNEQSDRLTPISEGRRLRLNETDSSTGSTVQDSDIENKPPGLDQEEVSTPEPAARVMRSPGWVPGRRALELGNVLQELALDVPEELTGQAQAPDSHSPPSSEGSPPKEQREKNLGELLDERIAANEGGRYSFDIYVDPENR
ncbi:unnamed protein product [Symbiodinium necroappetens]|uniref:Uncharacterized protein n=1 Tax=Symbiodinium necroappetens TaxID=1628268 RepID=A0A812JCQ7_9DINO|nr:unnamed protein product [Symbiodinium necroappetens]